MTLPFSGALAVCPPFATSARGGSPRALDARRKPGIQRVVAKRCTTAMSLESLESALSSQLTCGELWSLLVCLERAASCGGEPRRIDVRLPLFDATAQVLLPQASHLGCRCW